MSHSERIRRHYEPRVESDRDGYDIADWASAASQMIRFEVFTENVALHRKSLLDIGCGVGDLFGFLQERGIATDYTGVDIVAKVADCARQRHPQGKFICADVFSINPFGRACFDVVFSSGTFNLNLGNNREFLPEALGRMFDLARECVAFNLLHDRTESRFGQCVYFNPETVRQMLRPFPCEVRILDNYLPNDFTVICTKA